MMEEKKPKTEPAMDGPKPPRKPPKVALDLLPPDDEDKGRQHKPRGNPRKVSAGVPKPAVGVPPSAIASETAVACPGCNTRFPIAPEVWGAVAECSECGQEFEIKAPPGKQQKSELAG